MGIEVTKPTVQDSVRFRRVQECSYRKVGITLRRRSAAVSIVAVSIVVSTYVVESRQQCRERSTAEHRAKLPLIKQQTNYVPIRLPIKINICTYRHTASGLFSWNMGISLGIFEQVAGLHLKCWTIYRTI